MKLSKSMCIHKEILALIVIGPSAQASEGCISQFMKSSSPDLFDMVISQFQAQFTNLKFDWVEAIEVSDEAEGSNCRFSLDSGHSIVLPMEASSYTQPNKYSKDF
ncbi:MAG: hypothetical protein KF802_15340 [Bdellovibrionaceae bacterium]|nr:hypothetical protein [Pseudobdellovibrionaceae bacterium]